MVHNIKVPSDCLFSYKRNLESAGKIVSLTFFPILASNKIFKLYWVVLASISWVFLTCLAMKIQTQDEDLFYLRTFCYNWKMKTHIYFCEKICLEETYVCILTHICAYWFSVKGISCQSCIICTGLFCLLVCHWQKV